MSSVNESSNCGICRNFLTFPYRRPRTFYQQKRQARANGLLEVTALISGDITRRNIPGNAFRRAKARLMKKGAEAGLISRSSAVQWEGRVVGSGQDSKQQDEAERALSLDEDMPADGALPRLRLMSELSRVSEEDSNCNTTLGASKSNRSVGELVGTEPAAAADRFDHRLGRSSGGTGGPFAPDSTSLWSEMVVAELETTGDPSAHVSNVGWKGGQGDDDPRTGGVKRGGSVRDGTGGSRSHQEEATARRSGIRLADSLQAAGVDRGRWRKSGRAEKRGTGRKSRGKGTASRSGVDNDTAGSTGSDVRQQRTKAVAGSKRRGRRGKSGGKLGTGDFELKGESPLDDVRRGACRKQFSGWSSI